MSMCDCNQGRLPRTCKLIEGARVMSEVQRFRARMFTPETPVVHASDFDRITAECKALQERLSGFKQGAKVEAAAGDEARAEVKALRAKLAERDALLREVLHYDMCQRTGDGFNLSDLLQRINLTIGGRA